MSGIGGFASPMPAGWHWSCSCGWGTGRHAALVDVVEFRRSHERWHDEQAWLAQQEQRRAAAHRG